MKLNSNHYAELSERCQAVAYLIKRVIIEYPAFAKIGTPAIMIEAQQELLDYYGLVIAARGNADEIIYDRAWWMTEMFYELLWEAPVIQGDPKALEIAENAAKNLWDLYQYLGNKYI